MISVMDLPAFSAGHDLDPGRLLEMVRGAGYIGIQHLYPEQIVGGRFPVTGMGRIDDPADADRLARAHHALGLEATSLHVGTGMESDAAIDRLIGAIVDASARHGYRLLVETHRTTAVQDIRRTVDMVDRFPDVRFAADLSHWYTGQEFIHGDLDACLDFLAPVFERVRFVQGRIGDSCCIQVDLTGREDADFVQHFRAMWTRCVAGFLKHAGPSDFIAFAPKLVPNALVHEGTVVPVNYARCVRAADGTLVEEGDRRQQARLLSRIADECFAAAMREHSSSPDAHNSQETLHGETAPAQHRLHVEADAAYETLTPDQARQYDEQGYFLFENAFTPAEVAEVVDAIAPFEKAFEDEARAREGGRYFVAKADAISFTLHLVTKSDVLKRFSKHPVIQKICRDIIGSDARLYWGQAVYKKPGNPERFPWHQDDGYSYIEPQQYLTCWVAISDATLENGCPQVVPEYHKRGTIEHHMTELGWKCFEEPERKVTVEAKSGDIVVFFSLTPHLTGPNLTTGLRKSYIAQYAPDGARLRESAEDEGTVQDDPVRQYLVEAA